jgi:hypothetical protein
MEYQFKKVTFFSLLNSFLKKRLSTKESLELLHNSKKYQADLEDFQIVQDSQSYLPNELHFNRFMINAKVKDNQIDGANACEDLSGALLRAYGEFFERLIPTRKKGIADYIWSSKTSSSISSNGLTTSNGFSFHSNFYDCVQGSLYELIERHSIIKSWYSKTAPLFKVSIDNDPFYRGFIDFCNKENIEYHILCLEDFMGVKSIAFILKSSSNPLFNIVCSFAAHHDIRKAVKKSYFEVLRSVLVGPKKMFEENNIDSVDKMSDVLDHSIYYQNPAKINEFKFWLDSECHTIDLTKTESISRYKEFLILYKIISKSSPDIHHFNTEELKYPWYCLKLTSSFFLEVEFCEDHDKIDKDLFYKLTKIKGNFKEPHPLA